MFIQRLLQTILPVISMESTVVDLQEAYKQADAYIEKLFISADSELQAAAKACLCDMIYESRESTAIPTEKLKELLRTDADINALRKALLKKARARLLFRAHVIFNPLPTRLGSLSQEDLQHVYFLHVPEQTNGWTCGLWGGYNAHALHRLRKEKRSLSNNDITGVARDLYAQRDRHIAATNKLCGKEEGITPDVLPPIDALIKFMEYLDADQKVELAKNIHFLIYSAEDKRPTFSEEEPAILNFLGLSKLEDLNAEEDLHNKDSVPIVIDIEAVCKKFRGDFEKDGMVSFLCYLFEPHPHWIKCSILQIDGYKPVMLILDSYNFAVTEDGDASKVISFVYEKMLRPLRETSTERD